MESINELIKRGKELYKNRKYKESLKCFLEILNKNGEDRPYTEKIVNLTILLLL